ncbi:MAG: serine hydrolase [Gemmatimonadota bacterium]|nr:serine hydrolase [Gemmatimonadota bacterium]
MHRCPFALALALCASPAASQSLPLSDHPRVRDALGLLEVWVDAQVGYQRIPGASMAVVHDQELVWSRGFGYANPDKKSPATPQTIYSICSISKLFTSVGVLQLRDAGKLRLDDPVASHLPWFTIKDTVPDGPPVTIEGLLTHSSGLQRESDYPYWSPPDFRFPTHDEIVARLKDQAALYPAQTYFQYSNLGITLAGEVIAAASGQPYGEYIRSRVLTPLGLTSTSPEIPTALHGTRMAVGYSAMTRAGTRERLPAFRGNGIAPAMGFASTVEDLARFASWQFRVLYQGDREVLGRNTLREMQRVHWVDPDWKTTWGLGFEVYARDKKTFVGHGGSCPGYRSHLEMQPDERVTIVFASSAGDANAEGFTRRAYEIMEPALTVAQDTTQRAAALAPDFAKYLGGYSEQPWSGEVAVVGWKGSLAMVYLPTDDPLEAMIELRHVAGDTFRRVRKDKSLGEEIRFELGADGRATRVWRHSNFSPRIR